ncbi:JAB domain-containing protein [Taibaiella soli]|uniref:DNA repair protein n=1 Tax=Taibaiella soli TaxID=1649169 RepID=A0A2W2BFJ1_9BACT|nr:JAB domain-containing protein [Taibaiella soli]PZF74999.1 DNA repair protein [Taibaiella soli]
MNVRLSKEQKVTILNSEDIYKIMQQVLLRENKIRRNQEHFWVIGLDNAHKILFIELVALGSNNIVSVKPPEVFRMGIYKTAIKVVLVHNHPSGVVHNVSDADMHLTDRFYKVGKLIQIEVLDHLVISETDFFSFREYGIMEQIDKSGRYEVDGVETAEILKFELKLQKELAAKRRDIEIAKRMKGEGVSDEFIQKMTGLTEKEMKKL